MNKVRLGIIGIGRIGINHARIATTLDNIDLVGYCDIIKEKANYAGSKYGVKVYYDYKEMVDCVDAVIVCVQTEIHYEIARFFIENRKHVLIEKPITINVIEAENLIELAQKKEIVLSCGHVERFNSAVIALNDIININNIISISVKRMSPMDYRVKDIDVVSDLMIHDIDIILSLMKPYKVINVMAMKSIVKSDSKERNHADYCVAQLEFENGAIADLTASRVTEKKIRKLYINELDRFIEVNYLDKGLTTYKNFTAMLGESSICNKDTKYQEESLIQKIFTNSRDSLYEEQKNFINAILGLDKLKVTGKDAVEALKIVKRIQEKIYA